MTSDSLDREWGDFLAGAKLKKILSAACVRTYVDPAGSRDRERQEARKCEQQVLITLQERSGGSETVRIIQSLSHTRTPGDAHCVAAIGAASEGVQGIGVDLELGTRAVTPGVFERICHPMEKTWQLGVLELWVIKEAAFKSNPRNAGTVTPQYRITAFNPLGKEGSVDFPGGGHAHFRLVHLDPWLIGLAYCL